MDRGEIRVAEAIFLHGDFHYSGQYTGLITLTAVAVALVFGILRESFQFSLPLRSLNSQPFCSYRLAGGIYHADIVGFSLEQEPRWIGSWFRVCSLLHWIRPSLKDPDDSDPDASGSENEGDVASRPQQAQSELQQLRDENARLKGLLAQKNYELKCCRQRGTRLADKLAAKGEKSDCPDTLALPADLKRGGKQRYFSAAGGITVALKIAISRASCSALGLVFGVDVHRTIVRNSIIWLRANKPQ